MRLPLLAGALALAVLVPTTAGGAARASGLTSSATVWSGYVTSPTDAGRELAPLAESDTGQAATIGITLDPAEQKQTWLGVGAAMTDSSLSLLAGRTGAMKLLFDPASAQGARLNLLRLPMSATDFSTVRWTFVDNPRTKTLTAPRQATNAAKGVLAAKAMRPDLKVIGAPWTAPAAMKTSRSVAGGALAPGQEGAYAAMLQAQVAWYQARRIPLKYLSLQNEPGYSTTGYPTMTMTDAQLARIAGAVAKPLRAKGVGLLAVDHNFDDRARVDIALKAAPRAYAAAAFHCYDGSPARMGGLKVPALVTECTSGLDDDATYGFSYLADVLVRDSIDAGSTGLLMWNLALTAQGGPKASGGCATCRGLLTIDPSTGAATPNPEFHALAHLSRAAAPGARVIGVGTTFDVPVVAFRNTGGTEHRFLVGKDEMFTFLGK